MKQKNRILTTIVALLISAIFLLPQNVQAAISGIDISNYNNISDYSKLQNSDVKVVIQKATEGETFTDKYLYYRAENIPKINKALGYYHFADNDGNPIGQAQHFVDKIKGLHSDTVYFLDIENESDWTKTQAVSFTNQFINYMQLSGYKCGLYTGKYFYYDYLLGSVPTLPLWLADYSEVKHIPENFSLQYSATGQIDGIDGDVDLDYFTDNIFINNDVKQAINAPLVITTPIVRDSKIIILQQNLNKVLRWGIAVDGINGNQTKNATKQVQRITGIEVDGIAGNQTNSVINQILSRSTLRYGSKGAAVKYLQYYLGIPNDGIFGRQTEYYVKRWQRSHGLYPDRIIGKLTWRKLLGL